MCGGAQVGRLLPILHAGLSPRVRGSPQGDRLAGRRHGSIPACAGEPWPACRTTSSTRVYPRVCGGATHRGWMADICTGLSPRVRGSRGVRGRARYDFVGLSPRVRGSPTGQIAVEGISRSIPACAGEPGLNPSSGCMIGVYPRVCGGAGVIFGSTASTHGLSPRVRGSLVRGLAGRRAQGSIPACAGEPMGGGLAMRRIRVYPRVCGGAVQTEYTNYLDTGLSPACAGEPRSTWAAPSIRGVYPRVCGGAVRWSSGRALAWGLSPRVPSPVSLYARMSRVYPRVCGGAMTSRFSMVPWGGLSPRVRGSLVLQQAVIEAQGSIPACAGEPPTKPNC